MFTPHGFGQAVAGMIPFFALQKGMEMMSGAPDAGAGGYGPLPQVVGGIEGYEGYPDSQAMFRQYAQSKAGWIKDPERRLAFEAGIDRFCKEAGFDDEDRQLMFELEKNGDWDAPEAPMRGRLPRRSAAWNWLKDYAGSGFDTEQMKVDRETAAADLSRREAIKQRSNIAGQRVAPGSTLDPGVDPASLVGQSASLTPPPAAPGTPGAGSTAITGGMERAFKYYTSEQGGGMRPGRAWRRSVNTFGLDPMGDPAKALREKLMGPSAPSVFGRGAPSVPPALAGYTPPPVPQTFGQPVRGQGSPWGDSLAGDEIPSPGNPHKDESDG
jgi:hypothetical protein